jgi:hypothetical protein
MSSHRFINIYLNIILPYTRRFSKGLFFFFANQNPVCVSKEKIDLFFHILVNLPVVGSAGMSAVSMSAALVISDTIID